MVDNYVYAYNTWTALLSCTTITIIVSDYCWSPWWQSVSVYACAHTSCVHSAIISGAKCIWRMASIQSIARKSCHRRINAVYGIILMQYQRRLTASNRTRICGQKQTINRWAVSESESGYTADEEVYFYVTAETRFRHARMYLQLQLC